MSQREEEEEFNKEKENEMSENIWLCARCAMKQGVQTETDPVILRECSACHIKNWVRPYGHAGADVGSSRVMEKRVTQTIFPELVKQTATEIVPHEVNETMSELEKLRLRIKELEKT